jgi:hypothetical protein
MRGDGNASARAASASASVEGSGIEVDGFPPPSFFTAAPPHGAGRRSRKTETAKPPASTTDPRGRADGAIAVGTASGTKVKVKGC